MNPHLFDQLPCGLVVTDPRGLVVESNAFMSRLVDEQAGIPPGTAIDQLLTPASRVFLQTHVWPTIVRQSCMPEVYLELAGAESRRRPVLVNLQQAGVGDQRQIIWVFVVTEERHRFEAALIQSRTRAEVSARQRAEHELFARTVTDAIPGLISYWDRDLICQYANAEFAAAAAPRTSRVLGTPMRMLLGIDSFPLRMDLAQLALHGAAQRDEQVLSAPEGTMSAAEVTYVSHRVGAGVAGVLIVMRDVSEMKRTELALRTEVRERALAETIARERGRVLDEAQRLGQIGSWHWQVDGDVVTWSAELYRMLGRNPACPAPSFAEQAELYTAESLSRLHGAVDACLRTRAPYTLELQYTLPDGSHGWLEARGDAECDAFGAVTGLRGTVQEISARRALIAQLAEQHERLRVTMQSIGDAVITTDADGHITWLNPVAERMTGWSVTDAFGQRAESVFRIVHERTGEAMESPFDRSRITGSHTAASRLTLLIARDGSTHAIDDSASPIFSDAGILLGVVLVFRDVTEQRQLTGELRHRATHDALTGLANRLEFETQLEELLADATSNATKHALLFIDLDRFKHVNDTGGHAAGDRLLCEVGMKMRSCIRSRDTLARCGGDEFAIILRECTVEQAQRVAQSVCDAIAALRFAHGTHRFTIGASVGIVPVDARWSDTRAVQHAADTACYSAKRAGRNRVELWDESGTGMSGVAALVG